MRRIGTRTVESEHILRKNGTSTVCPLCARMHRHSMMTDTLAMLSAACSIWSCKEQPSESSFATVFFAPDDSFVSSDMFSAGFHSLNKQEATQMKQCEQNSPTCHDRSIKVCHRPLNPFVLTEAGHEKAGPLPRCLRVVWKISCWLFFLFSNEKSFSTEATNDNLS
jgi:hypothetical protein